MKPKSDNSPQEGNPLKRGKMMPIAGVVSMHLSKVTSTREGFILPPLAAQLNIQV